jgi:parallel beta-helix repeat protein
MKVLRLSYPLVIAGLLLILIEIFSTTPSTTTLASPKPRFIYVPDDYSSIQLAVDNANSGDVILVREGVYVENIVIKRKSDLVIKPVGGDTVIVRAKDEGQSVFSIQFSRNITILRLTITGGEAYRSAAIYILNSSNVFVQECTLYSNNAGVWIAYSSNITITKSNVLGNNYGVIVQYSKSTTIVENNINYNGIGIDFVDASNNTIYRNNFINNNQHVRLHKSVNKWHAQYPLGGNYWSGYDAEDVKKGSSQDEPGADGILDAPYRLDDDNVDYYPLAQPLAFQIVIATPIVAVVTQTLTPLAITVTQKIFCDECTAALILLVVAIILIGYLVAVQIKARKKSPATKTKSKQRYTTLF